MLRKSIPIAIGTALLAWSAQAATLTNVEGAVSINQGFGEQQGVTGVALNPGDRVKVGEGSADIIYVNGCSTRVGPNQTAAVLSNPPSCTGGGGLKDGIVVEEAPATGSLVIGGLIIAGSAGVAAAIATGNNSSPSASP